jgi:hypothetical protein
MKIKSYQDLVAWQKGIDLCELVYRARLGYLSSNETGGLFELTNEIGKLTNGLIRSLTGRRSN